MSIQPFSHTHRVTYAECTVGNHVYYGRYLDLLEEARGELFRALGIPLTELQVNGTLFPVTECQLRYKAPARYDEVLAIEVSISELNRIKIVFGYRIQTGGKLILEGSTTHVATGLDEKPKRMPMDLLERLERFKDGLGNAA